MPYCLYMFNICQASFIWFILQAYGLPCMLIIFVNKLYHMIITKIKWLEKLLWWKRDNVKKYIIKLKQKKVNIFIKNITFNMK